MRLNSRFDVLLSAQLKECVGRPRRIAVPQRHNIKEVAVLGGGITGLASAFYISEAFKDVPITLYESGPRLGGWLRSASVDVGTGNVVFEQGPRTLRPSVPNGLVTLDLMRKLDLGDQVLMTSKESVAAQNRFVYYPDHLVRMPGPGRSFVANLLPMLSEPVFHGALSGFLKETFQPKVEIFDESVGAFISRHFGSAVADNIVSAVLHGIYAGDVYQLSARSILPKVYKISESYGGALVLGMIAEASRDDPLTNANDSFCTDVYKNSMLAADGKLLPGTEVFERIMQSSVFTFRRGIGQLAESLEVALNNNPNVTILKNTPIECLSLINDGDGSKIQLTPQQKKGFAINKQAQCYSNVISTVSGRVLNAITQPANTFTSLAVTPSVTVMVVNLYYSNPDLLPYHGFGYLIPRSIPIAQNPERALGVVFDSDATIGQDEIAGTKLTVMLGGHWWDNWDTYPDEGEGEYMAKAIIARHLNILEEPQAVRVSLQRECIPQYTVGHVKRMEEASASLLRIFDGKLRVAGNSFTGVGLNDCIRAARDLVTELEIGMKSTGLGDRIPGLETWKRSNRLKKAEP